MNILNWAMERVLPRFINAQRMLKEQLETAATGARLSPGCLAAFADAASTAAVRAEDKGERPYTERLRREIAVVSEFIVKWTGSDEPFAAGHSQELVAIARKFALPRPWKQAPTASITTLQNAEPLRAAAPARANPVDASALVERLTEGRQTRGRRI